MKRAGRGVILGLLSIGGIAAAIACGAGDFDAESKVNTVRMFGVVADKPYANPGDKVTLTTLTTDARRDKPLPLKTYWIPFTCTNPREDLYYACFLPPEGGAGDGGAGAALSAIPKNIDLGPFLPTGDTYSFTVPNNVIQPRVGSVPYGLMIVFNIACAGQVRLADRSGINPQQVPIKCTDQNGVELTPNDYVIGINRVYSYATRTNANPVISGVTLNALPVDSKAGLTIDHCVASRRSDCKEWKIDVKVPDSSWEPDPEEGTAASNQHEQIWVDYYSDLGDFENDARLLFDSTRGRVTDSDVKYRAPYAPGEGTVWAVVHDNRAGAAFVVMPLHIK
jgi:hypothetical protein